MDFTFVDGVDNGGIKVYAIDLQTMKLFWILIGMGLALKLPSFIEAPSKSNDIYFPSKAEK